MDSHLMLEIAHEVVITSVKSYQPHTHKCTCTQVPYILSCANNCCSQASQPFVEHVIIETCDDSITKENEELKEVVERLRRDLIQWKGKCNAQSSQDNREDMLKKLMKGSIEACIKPHQEGHKSNCGKVKGKFKKAQCPNCSSSAQGCRGSRMWQYRTLGRQCRTQVRQCRTWAGQQSPQGHQGTTLTKEDSHHLLHVQERREGHEQDSKEEEDGS
jgi:hypothetical protein